MKTIILATLTALASALVKRQTVTDADILQYALTLEHLEDTFYRGALQNFTKADFAAAGYDATVYANIQTIAFDERTHVEFLTTALSGAGANPVAECVYNFPYTDVNSFLGLSKVLENVGVSAYIGAAPYITTDAYLVAAATILTVEARHSAYIQSIINGSPFPAPFDTPLDLNPVYTLAASFIVSCPDSNVMLPVRAYPALNLTSPTPFLPNSSITLTSAAATSSETLYAAFFSGINVYYVPYTSGQSLRTPSTVLPGQTYVVLTTSSDNVSDSNIVAGPAIINVQTAAQLSTAGNYSSGSTGNQGTRNSTGGSGSPTNQSGSGLIKASVSGLTLAIIAAGVMLA